MKIEFCNVYSVKNAKWYKVANVYLCGKRVFQTFKKWEIQALVDFCIEKGLPVEWSERGNKQ